MALLISQFEKDISGHPGLLRFSEVVNLFHEFGHVVCFLLYELYLEVELAFYTILVFFNFFIMHRAVCIPLCLHIKR